ncbi:MAG TPA: hypothetical protein PLJ47_07670 [Candidatus Hydrogenedentes bacterium]|nr:hypothetical protein [Candidatus Hydrogenedentota bacterium]
MGLLGQTWPRREWVRGKGEGLPLGAESGGHSEIRRFPTVTPAGIRQGLSVPDGKRGLSLLAAAFLKRLPSDAGQKRPRGTQALFFEQGQIETAAANFAGYRLNPDWLELLLGLPLGWTNTARGDACLSVAAMESLEKTARGDARPPVERLSEFEDWFRGWTALDSWGYGPGWWLGYTPGTEDLPGSVRAWERDVPRVTNCVNAGRCRLCAMAIVPIQMVAAVDAMVSRRDMETA